MVAALTALASAAVGIPAAVAAPEPAAQPPRHESALFDSTYQSLVERVTDRGYAPTSLTGYYGAMYTRDSSVNALALLLGGDDTDARAILRYIFRYSAAAGAPRMPHRIYEESDTPAPSGQQTDTSTPLSLSPEAARLVMPAPGLVTATDLWLSRTAQARGSVRATLLAGTGPQAQVVDTTSIRVAQIPLGGGWVTARFLPPLFDTPPAGYTVRLSTDDTPPGSVTAWGAADGTLAYRERVTDFHISGYDMYDETDQAYSVLLVWARYVRANPNDQAFVAETWPYVQRYANYYLDTPGYLNGTLNLVRNPILDDEGYHNTYDLLTNVFVSQSLRELAPLAQRLGDPVDAQRWSAVAEQVRDGIDANLVTTVDGQRIYGEKYEVEQGNAFHAGYSFVNLSPMAVDWYGLDAGVMANTLQAYLAHASRDWSGEQMLSSMQNYGFSGHNDWVLTKGLAWEWRFDQEHGNQARLDVLDQFLSHYYPDASEPISEGWILDSDGSLRITDPGNQEHASWYAVEMLEAYPALRAHAAAVDVRLRHEPVLSTSAPASVHAGVAFTVTATFYHTTADPVTYTSPELAVPADWTANNIGITAQVAPGDPAVITWTVTPPVDAPAGAATLGVSVAVGGQQDVRDNVRVQIVPPAANLAAAANNIGITDDANPTLGNFDGGNSLSAQALAAAGLTPGTVVDHSGLRFTWPAQPSGTPDNVVGHATVRLTGRGSKIGFLGAGVHNQTGTATVVYSDGTSQAVTISFPNYAGTVPLNGAENIATANYRNTRSGPANFGVGYHVYYWSAAIQPDKTVAMISLPDNASMHVFAMSVAQS
jgi:hypothetical protein